MMNLEFAFTQTQLIWLLGVVGGILYYAIGLYFGKVASEMSYKQTEDGLLTFLFCTLPTIFLWPCIVLLVILPLKICCKDVKF